VRPLLRRSGRFLRSAVAYRYKVLLITTLISLALDQASKFYIDQTFTLYQSLVVIENFFNITYIRNQGAAFGIFSDSSLRIPFFITIAVVASVVILWVIHRLKDEQKVFGFGLSLIFSGAIDNLIDRIRLGEVIDFLDVHWYRHHWPAFNVADSAISVGVALLIWDMWREERNKRRAENR
jgi:signal peptidase II